MITRRGLSLLLLPYLMLLSLVLFSLAVTGPAVAGQEFEPQPQLVERGRYLIQVAGCNDCHTPGYGAQEGSIPEQQWLTGDRLGWYGPWGTTYPTNLRNYMAELGENEWLALARGMKTRPPMPWFNLRIMTDEDLRAMYHFIRHLGPAGEPEPKFLPPGDKPDSYFVDMTGNRR